MRALWLPDVIADAGFDLHVEPGWETRGSANWGPIKAVVCHHTAWPLNSQDYPVAATGKGRERPQRPLTGPRRNLRRQLRHLVTVTSPFGRGHG